MKRCSRTEFWKKVALHIQGTGEPLFAHTYVREIVNKIRPAAPEKLSRFIASYNAVLKSTKDIKPYGETLHPQKKED
jgi:hypothetical protein